MGTVKNSNKDRAYELDLLRGIALVMMMCMHFSYDVRYEFGCDAFSYLESDWYWVFVHPIILVLFVGVSGICCSFSRNNLKRGARLLGVALAFTIGTVGITYLTYWLSDIYSFVPAIYCVILFNVLHVLSVSTLFYALLEYLFTKMKLNDKAQAVILGLLGTYITILIMRLHYLDGTSSNWLLIPFGIEVEGAPSVVDYMNLIPWSGVFLIGAAVGKICYKEKRSLFPKPNDTICKIKAPVEFLGRHSLIVYLVHQPIGYGILYLFLLLIGKI